MKTLRKPLPARPAGGRSATGVRLAMFGLALVGLVGFEGCQSACGGCGGGGIGGVGSRVSSFGQKVGQGVGRIFHPRRWSAPASECCDGGAGGVVIDGGAATVVPGPVITNPADSGTIELAPALPSGAKAGAKDQGSLRSAPTGGGTKMSYETERPVLDGPRARNERANVAGNLLSSPAGGSSAGSPPARHPLDDLPPVDLSKDVTLKATSAPVPVEAEKLTPPASARVDSKGAKTTDAGASAAEPPTAVLPVPAATAMLEGAVAPGIARFNGVEPNLAGGGFPDKDGLEWLKEKGYRTLIDLRDKKSVASTSADEVQKLGFRYVSLPFDSSKIDTKQVQAFRDEIAKADARPIYFCDEDGAKAAVLWYVHRVTEAGVDAAVARREADEIRPLSDAQRLVADDFIKSRPAKTVKAKPISTNLLEGSAVLRFTKFDPTAASIPAPRSLNSAGRSASPKGSERYTLSDLPSSGD